MRHNQIIPAALLVCLAGAAAQAEDTMLILGGEASGHRSAYGQAGIITALPGSQLGDGWVARALVNGVTYRYRGAPGIVDGTVGGGGVALGYQDAGAPGWWAFYTGPVYRYTHLSPRDPASDAAGGDFGWLAQAEAEHAFTQDFKVNVSGSYTVAANGDYWSRARLLYRVSGEMFIGPEAIWQGDHDYKAWALGAGLFGIELRPGTQLGLRGGIRKTEHLSASPYGGIELSDIF